MPPAWTKSEWGCSKCKKGLWDLTFLNQVEKISWMAYFPLPSLEVASRIEKKVMSQRAEPRDVQYSVPWESHPKEQKQGLIKKHSPLQEDLQMSSQGDFRAVMSQWLLWASPFWTRVFIVIIVSLCHCWIWGGGDGRQWDNISFCPTYLSEDLSKDLQIKRRYIQENNKWL